MTKMNQGGWVYGALLGLIACANSCAANTVASTYAQDFDCSEDQVSVDDLGKRHFRVTGCGRSVTYECVRSCVTTDDDYGAPSADAPAERRVASRTSGSTGSDEARVEKSKNGVNTVALDLRLDAHTLLKLRAVPTDKQGRVQFLIARIADDDDLTECPNTAMINGDRMDLPSGKFIQSAHTKDMLIALPTGLLREFAVARKFALKTCDLRWNLADSGVSELRRFAELYQQEIAWLAPARTGGTGGLIAPADGWPEWKAITAAPAAKAGSVLEGPALFKLISPSVFKVIVNSALGTTQGSAVAISTSQLLTNCHVLESGQKITLQQAKKERIAQLAFADPAADRCVLSVADATLTPIRGLRAQADLEVGEPLYTLGSPNGLELSIANGVLSGLREERGYTYVQTTAPISPGSSGGGLFDARGNLVGITTMVLVGSEHLNQALNFAIPAEFFAKP